MIEEEQQREPNENEIEKMVKHWFEITDVLFHTLSILDGEPIEKKLDDAVFAFKEVLIKKEK